MLSCLEERGVSLVRGRAGSTASGRVRVGDDQLVAARRWVVGNRQLTRCRRCPAWPTLGLGRIVEATTAKHVPARLAVLAAASSGRARTGLAGARVGGHVAPSRLAADRARGTVRERPGRDCPARGRSRRTTRHGRRGRIRGTGAVELKLEERVRVSRRTSCSSPSAARLEPRTWASRRVGVTLEPGRAAAGGRGPARLRPRLLYAVGDVNGRALLTHMGKYQARPARRRDPRQERSAAVRTEVPRRASSSPTHRWRGRAHDGRGRRGRTAGAVGEVETGGNAGGSFVGPHAPGTARLVGRRGSPRGRRRHHHRAEIASACTQRRSRCSATCRSTTSARRPGVPDAVGSLWAAPARVVRPVEVASAS